MGASFDETMREAEEESGFTRGGARLQKEKRHRIGEGPTVIETKNHEGQTHRKN